MVKQVQKTEPQSHYWMSVWIVNGLDKQVAPWEVLTATSVWMCVKAKPVV